MDLTQNNYIILIFSSEVSSQGIKENQHKYVPVNVFFQDTGVWLY